MAAALALPPLARAMQEPAGPERGLDRFPPCLSSERLSCDGDTAAELLWRPLLDRRRGAARRRRSALRYRTLPSAARRGPGELSRSLAWQLGGPEPCPPAGRPRSPEGGRNAGEPPPPAQPSGTGLKFGLLPPELHARLLDQEDYKKRTQAVEELKRVVEGASQDAVGSTPVPSLLGLIGFLCTLLDDSNFKVVLGALETIHLLAQRLGDRVQAFLAPLVSAAAKVLGDNKLAVRRLCTRLFLRLMKAAGPRQLLALLLQRDYLRHKNSRVREEVLNVCIAALLTYPGEELDLAGLAPGLAPALLDGKRRVRHAAMEAFAALAAALGPAGTPLLLEAVGAVEAEEKGAGVTRAVQARLARKVLPRLAEQGFVEYAVPLPSAGRGGGSCLPPGADTDWLLMGGRTQSAHGYCGYHPRDEALPASDLLCGRWGGSLRRVLSAGKGRNKLPWETSPGGREPGPGVGLPLAKAVQQFSTTSDFLHSPKLRPCQGAPVNEELFFSRKRVSGILFQNSIHVNSEPSSVCVGTLGSPHPQLSGKCGTLGPTWMPGQSSSTDSDFHCSGLNSCQEDKVCARLNFSSKTQGSFCSQAEHPMTFQGANVSQGTFILPSFPLSSPRNSPKHVSQPGDSARKSQDNTMSFSNSWPLKSFEGQPKPSSQKQFLSQKPGENTGHSMAEQPSPLQLKATLERCPGTLRTLSGDKPVPPIPRQAGPAEMQEPQGLEGGKLEEELNLSGLNLDDEEVDQEEMQQSLRCLRSSEARKRAQLSGQAPDLGSPDSAITSDLSGDSPSRTSSPSTATYSESGVYSQESLTSPVSTRSQRRTSDTFLLLGSKSQPATASSARSRDPNSSPGVFGSPPAHSQPTRCAEHGDAPAVNQEDEPSPEVCGRSIQQNSFSHFPVEDGEEIKVVMSKSAQDKMRRKKKEEKGHNHKGHQEVKDLQGKEENPWERLKLNEAETVSTEKPDLCGDILTSSLPLENMAWNSSLKRTCSLKRSRCSASLESDESALRTQRCYRHQAPAVSHSPEIMHPSELKPSAEPETALAEALALLANDYWEKKIEGLNMLRCLSAYHGTVLTEKLHEISLAVAQEVKNLRSGVSRAAVVCLGDLFTHLKKSMDQELDYTVKVLLHKAGESNTFIREEVDKALKAMVNNVTPARALCSLINGGQSHLHSAVRRCAAQHLCHIVERLGPEWILSGPKALAERLFLTLARFAQDSSQQTRYYGRKMLYTVMRHQDFEKALKTYVPTKDLPHLKECVSNLWEKGLGDMPLDTPSAKGQRSQGSSVGHLKSSSTSRHVLSVTDREAAEGRVVSRKAAPCGPLDNEERVKSIIGSLNAKDFRERIGGVERLLWETQNNQGFVVANMLKIFDAFKSRLHDSNSKVNQVALETMHQMIPLLKDNLSPVINMLIPAIVDNNLNSKNPRIYAAATNVIEALCQNLDNYLLLQPFCTKAQFLNGRAKQDMTERVADLATELYPRRPYAVEQKVLVVLWQLLGSTASGGSSAATVRLAKALHAQMGPGLLAHAAAQPPRVRESLEELLEMGT